MPKKVVAEIEVNGWKFARKEDGTVKMSFQFMTKYDMSDPNDVITLVGQGDFFTKDDWQKVVDAMRGEPVPCSPTCKVGPQGGCACPSCVPGNTP